MAQLTVIVFRGTEWKTVPAALRYQEKNLQRKLTDAMEQTAQGSVKKVKRNALLLPATQGKHSGIRARLARGVRLKVRQDLGRIETNMTPDEVAMPWAFDSPVKGWEHPTFGHDPVVRQFPGTHDGWFSIPLEREEQRFDRAFEDVLEAAAAMIDASD